MRDAPRVMAATDVEYRDGSMTNRHRLSRGRLLCAVEGVMIARSEQGIWIVPPSRALWVAAGFDVKMSGPVKIRVVSIDRAAVPHFPARSCVIEISPLLRELIVAAGRIPLDYEEDSRNDRLMRLLADEVLTSDVLALHLPLPVDPLIKSVCEEIAAYPADSATASDWARRLNVTPKTVHRRFVRETGMTFAQWREQARLLFAIQRLADGQRVADVALNCGYASQSAFTAMFRRHFGKPPSEFYR